MHIFNRTLWFIFLISSLLLLTLNAQEYNEDLPDLRLEGSDTYNDGTIILLFAQKNNETKKYVNAKIHLRIVFVDRTILPVEIDYSSYPNFIYEYNPTNLMLNTLTLKALIENYVLIESKDQNGLPYKQMIVSWDGIIHGMYGFSSYEVTVDINSMQKFFITELYNNTTLIQRIFTVQNPNNLNSSLNEENRIYNELKDNTTIYFYTTFSLVEGGYATIIFRETKSNKANKLNNNNKTTIREIYVIYLKDDDFTSYKQYLLYSSISGNALSSVEGGCKNSFDGSGYTLDFVENLTKEKGETYNSFRIHFSSNGAVTFIDTNNFDALINPVAPLFYGGYLKYNFTSSLLTVYNDDKSINKVLNLTLNSDAMDGLKPFIMQKQSSVWSIDYNNKVWNINYYPLDSIDVTDSRYIYQNPSISGTYPSINENFQISSTIKKPFDFIINYNRPITLSNGNMAIFQYLDNNDIILRQIISGQSELCQLVNETAISVKIFSSALHQKNVKYGIRVENNFAKSKYNEEALLGVSERIWTFNTFLENPEKPADQVTFTARLKFGNGNVNFYNEINSKNSLIILQQLNDELVQAIPIDEKRLIINTKVQNENTDDENQVLISATIIPPDTNNNIERNTDSVLKDLNELIQQKKYNLILRGNITKFIDENYGVQIIPDFWARYTIILIVLVIGIVIVSCLILFANYKDKEGKNFSIVKIIIILYDLVLDVAFVAKNANDVPNLFVYSLCSVIIPIIFNMGVVIYSLIQEIIYNQDFNKWCKKNSFIISIFTILSSTDVEALHILSSKIAGLNAFSAPPLSSKISKLVFWAGCINIFLENIPQFIIQVYYYKSIIVYTIIPSLSLISSSIILCVSFVGKIYFFFMYLYKNNNFNRRTSQDSQQLGDVKL